MDLSELIERLEKATGPDRELDWEIALATGVVCRVEAPTRDWFFKDRQYFLGASKGERGGFGHKSHEGCNYTASIDAAISLVPEQWFLTLDRYSISDKPEPNSFTWRVCLKHLHGDLEGDGPVGLAKTFATSATPAIALCIASLKALMLILLTHTNAEAY